MCVILCGRATLFACHEMRLLLIVLNSRLVLGVINIVCSFAKQMKLNMFIYPFLPFAIPFGYGGFGKANPMGIHVGDVSDGTSPHQGTTKNAMYPPASTACADGLFAVLHETRTKLIYFWRLRNNVAPSLCLLPCMRGIEM